MTISAKAKAYWGKIGGAKEPLLKQTDPELWEIMADFACDEVVSNDDLDDKTRFTAILAALLGCQGCQAFSGMVQAALNIGLTPVTIREIVYQATAYLGIGRTLPFITAMNECFTAAGIKLPLADQATTSRTNRRQRGTEAQIAIFGPAMKDFYKSGPADRRHINKWLAANCFGDYYTRNGLDYKQREMITFCFLAAQGGCEPQLVSHAAGNIRIGNDKAFLIKVVSQCLPYIGYPRSLNALACISKAADRQQ